MEKRQSDHIRDNLPDLIKTTDCNTQVFAELVSKKVFSPTDVEALSIHSGNEKRAYEFYQLLGTRRRSYGALIEALHKTNQTGALKILRDLPVPPPHPVKVESEKLQKSGNCCQPTTSNISIAQKVLDAITSILKRKANPDEPMSLSIISNIFQRQEVLDQIDEIICNAMPRNGKKVFHKRNSVLAKEDKKKLKQQYRNLLEVELHTLKSYFKRTPIRELLRKHDTISEQVMSTLDTRSGQQHKASQCWIEPCLKKCFQKVVLSSNRIFIHVENLDLPVVGIDFGTSSTSVVQFEDSSFHNLGKSIFGHSRIPSYLHFDSKGKATISMDKLRNNVAFDIKHLLGRSMQDKILEHFLLTWPFESREQGNGMKVHLQNNFYFLEEILAAYLNRLVHKTKKCEIQNLLLTVPNMFNSRQRMAVLNSMKIAGIFNCDIVNDGTAAVFAYAHDQWEGIIERGENIFNIKTEIILAISFGGGCLNISLARVDFAHKTIEILAQTGDANLGGRNIDKSVLECVLGKLKESKNLNCEKEVGKDMCRNLQDKCKNIKETLPATESEKIFVDGTEEGENPVEVTLLDSDLNEICKPIVDEVIETLMAMFQSTQPATAEQNISQVILHGGLWRMEPFERRVHELFDERVRNYSDDLIAKGAALFAWYNNPFRLLSDNEVFPLHVFGQFVKGSSTPKKNDLFEIFKRNGRIPVRHTLRPELRDPSVQLLIFQSESMVMEELKAHLVGQYEIACEKHEKCSESVEVLIDIGRNGALQVQACYRSADDSSSSGRNILVSLENKLDLGEKQIYELADKLKYTQS